jgi:hypothetical protein
MKLDEILTEMFDVEALSAYQRRGDDRIRYQVDGVPWTAQIFKDNGGRVGGVGAGPQRKLSPEESTPRQALVGFGTVVKWLADEIKAGNIKHKIHVVAADDRRLRIYTNMAKKLIEPIGWTIEINDGRLVATDQNNVPVDEKG